MNLALHNKIHEEKLLSDSLEKSLKKKEISNRWLLT